MRATTGAALGSLAVNLALALLVGALFSAAPSAQAEGLGHKACAHPVPHPKPGPVHTAPAPARRAYLVEARMGWGPAG